MLRADLDIDALGARLRADGRLVIPEVLDHGVATSLCDSLGRNLPWELAYRDNRYSPEHQSQRMSQADFRALGPARAAALQREVLDQAREHFQYLYQFFNIPEGIRSQQPPGLYLYDFYKFLQSDAFLGPIRELCGTPELNHVFAHATLYSAGNFLKVHEDIVPNRDRRFAYVLGLTRGWQADMGGLLHFLDERDQITDTVVPGFNSLTLFAVPTRHLVSTVAPWVNTPRLAITGWLMVKA
ncbi:MAG: 2OG-Fe(II) oxygenase family protein [Gammaproteobacteria bacterium]